MKLNIHSWEPFNIVETTNVMDLRGRVRDILITKQKLRLISIFRRS